MAIAAVSFEYRHIYDRRFGQESTYCFTLLYCGIGLVLECSGLVINNKANRHIIQVRQLSGLAYTPTCRSSSPAHYLNVCYSRKNRSSSAQTQRLWWLPDICHPAKHQCSRISHRRTESGKPKAGQCVVTFLRRSRSPACILLFYPVRPLQAVRLLL